MNDTTAVAFWDLLEYWIVKAGKSDLVILKLLYVVIAPAGKTHLFFSSAKWLAVTFNTAPLGNLI